MPPILPALGQEEATQIVAPFRHRRDYLRRAICHDRGGRSRGPVSVSEVAPLARRQSAFCYPLVGGSGPQGTVVVLPAASVATSEGWPLVVIWAVRTPGPGRTSEPELVGSTVSIT